MSGPAYYNEFEPYAADWLENLIAAGHLPAGDVDRRDIREVRSDDLKGFGQCHFFAGIGGWPLAVALAGWQGPVWTGSCPCQPLSSAGQRKGHADERHLWPAFYELIAERRPPTIFGEQVASALGREWLAGVRADMEGLEYALGAADLCAAGAGAPHIRQRLFWVAAAHVRHAGAEGLQRGGQQRQLPQNGSAVGGMGDAASQGRHAERQSGEAVPRPGEIEQSAGSGNSGGLGDADRERPQARRPAAEAARSGGASKPDGRAGGLGNPGGAGPQEPEAPPGPPGRRGAQDTGSSGGLGDAPGERRQGDQRRARPGEQPEPAGPGFWRDFDLIPCADGKARRVEPGTFPLAHGIPQRVGQLRAYGNAITPQLGAEFVTAFMECRP